MKHIAVILMLSLMLSFRINATTRALYLAPSVIDIFDGNSDGIPIWRIADCGHADHSHFARLRINPKGEYFEVINGVTDIYLFKNDTIHYRGWNRGRSSSVLCNNPVPLFPLSNDCCVEICSSFTGKGIHCVDTPFVFEGMASGKKMGRGILILSPADTLDNVTLVHETRQFQIRLHDEVSDPEHSSAVSIYRWYCEGDSLPFAIQYKTGGESRLYIDDRSSIDKSDENEAAIKEWLSNIAMQVSAGIISFRTPSIDIEAVLDIYVMDVAGNIYSSRNISASFEGSSFDIPVKDIPHGNYIVSIIAAHNGLTVNEKRMIVL